MDYTNIKLSHGELRDEHHGRKMNNSELFGKLSSRAELVLLLLNSTLSVVGFGMLLSGLLEVFAKQTSIADFCLCAIGAALCLLSVITCRKLIRRRQSKFANGVARLITPAKN